MRSASGWASRADYIRFLELQYGARKPVEDWLAARAPAHFLPPAQTPLIARDLTAMQVPVCDKAPRAPFEPPVPSDASVLGAAWVLAGSSLGNRTILKELKRMNASQGEFWPSAFLADPAMLAFWQRLRTRIERPVREAEANAARIAAERVFAHFINHASGHTQSGDPGPSEQALSNDNRSQGALAPAEV